MQCLPCGAAFASKRFRMQGLECRSIHVRVHATRPTRGLGQVLVVLELVAEDDTVGCDLVLARERVMGAAAGFENR